MFKIVGIRQVGRPDAKDIYYGPTNVIRVVPAEVEAFYELDVTTGDQALVFEAEVRSGPHGLGIDWSDEFQDFLMDKGCDDADFNAISLLIHETHCARHRGFPARPKK